MICWAWLKPRLPHGGRARMNAYCPAALYTLRARNKASTARLSARVRGSLASVAGSSSAASASSGLGLGGACLRGPS
eukprot:3119035-Amphidinium_carterae.1